jgi:hypothetical protein
MYNVSKKRNGTHDDNEVWYIYVGGGNNCILHFWNLSASTKFPWSCKLNYLMLPVPMFTYEYCFCFISTECLLLHSPQIHDQGCKGSKGCRSRLYAEELFCGRSVEGHGRRDIDRGWGFLLDMCFLYFSTKLLLLWNKASDFDTTKFHVD